MEWLKCPTILDVSDCHCISYISLRQKTLVNSKLEGVIATQQARKSSITNCFDHVFGVVLENNVNRRFQNARHLHIISSNAPGTAWLECEP